MMRHTRLKHRFVHHIPERLESGVLYISVDYGTAAHLCCCGCREEVVTPFSPTDWKMTFDGETISLWPSIGNWNIACRSHYVIDQSRVIEAGPWTDDKIAIERRRDKAAKAKFFCTTESVESNQAPPTPFTPCGKNRGVWRRIKNWLSRMKR